MKYSRNIVRLGKPSNCPRCGQVSSGTRASALNGLARIIAECKGFVVGENDLQTHRLNPACSSGNWPVRFAQELLSRGTSKCCHAYAGIGIVEQLRYAVTASRCVNPATRFFSGSPVVQMETPDQKGTETGTELAAAMLQYSDMWSARCCGFLFA